MNFTKTDFIHYLNCPKSLWFLKNKPELYPHAEFSTFLQKLVREGYEVERYFQNYFELLDDDTIEYQRIFETHEGLLARADALRTTAEGKVILYEVKSSNRVKTDNLHNHLKDACFQTICAERSGKTIDKICIVHLNGEYVRDGDVEPQELLIEVDVTAEVRAIEEETELEIDEALEFLESAVDTERCSCIEKSRGHHCDTFSIFNSNIPSPSIYSLPRLNDTKRRDFLSREVIGLEAITEDDKLSSAQRLVVQAAQAKAAQINVGAIRNFLSRLQFPLYFFDFETFSSAVPFLDGASPHKHIPVQYSLHILSDNENLEHREYLERQRRMPSVLIENMRQDIGPTGSIISWHASFEKTQNKMMAELYADKAEFLHDLNDRMIDLEDVFKLDYVDVRFDGSTSIKKVLPVICPSLDYSDLVVQDGSSAMEAWERMIEAEPEESDQIAKELLKYCERDTLAMVEIYRYLSDVVK